MDFQKLLSESTVETRLPAEKKYISKWRFFFFSKEMCQNNSYLWVLFMIIIITKFDF